MSDKAPTRLAKETASDIMANAYESFSDYYQGSSSFDSDGAAVIIQSAIDTAVREALEQAAERAVKWTNKPNDLAFEHEYDDDYWNDALRAAILGGEE